MREFFVNLLKELKNLTGSNQYVEIASMPTEEESQEVLDDLLKPLINVCNTFNYMTKDAKQRIIRRKLLEDQKFYGLTAQKVYQYLASCADQYFTESHHLEVNQIEDVRGEPLSEETEKQIEEFKRNLVGSAMSEVITGVPAEIEKIKREDKERIEGKKAATYTATVDLQTYQLKEAIKVARKEFYGLGYVDAYKWDIHEVEGCEIFCASMEDAREIYLKATE